MESIKTQPQRLVRDVTRELYRQAREIRELRAAVDERNQALQATLLLLDTDTPDPRALAQLMDRIKAIGPAW